MDTNKKIEFITKVYENLQNLIALADNKANISLTIQTFLLSIVLGSSYLTGIFGTIKEINDFNSNLYLLFLGVYVLSSSIGIGLSITVTKARFPSNKDEKTRKGLLYFVHIAKYKNFEEYYEVLNKLDEASWFKEYCLQVYAISHIVCSKMKYINLSKLFLIINLIYTMVILYIGSLFIK